MKNLLISLFVLTSFSTAFADWKYPQIVCPERAVPQGLTCLDLTAVANPGSDFPAGMNADVIEKWKKIWTADLKVCRGREVLRREAAHPGSFTPLQVQIHWMNAGAGVNSQDKLVQIRAASRKYDIPVHTLVGALTQESLLADLGISPDGGNYSCGMAQLNIYEWCNGMATLSAAQRATIGWPDVACDGSVFKPEMIAPFFKIASRNLNGRPEYQIDAKDFQGITLAQVNPQLPAATPAVQNLRFKAITSFLSNCQNHALSIPIKAKNLKGLFDAYVPAKMKRAEVYSATDNRPLYCEDIPYITNYYPLHTGWLLTLAIYNAGPSVAKILEHYYQTDAESLPAMAPTDLIEALYWGGEYRSNTGRVHYVGSNQRDYSQSWTKSCVVQRHIARVIQHVSIPGGPVLANSLEEIPCANGIPESRQNSSGVRD